MGGALITQGREIEAVEEMLAGPEQPWRDRHVQLVDEPRFEVLADRRHAAADLHILSLSSRRRSFQRLADTARDKVEDRPAFHLNRRAAVMRQHKYGAVLRRVLSPPAAPGVVGPGTTNRAEHVAPHNPGANALPKTRRDIVIDAGGAAGLTIDALERAGLDKPFVQRFTTDAEGLLASLVRASAVAVERNREVMHAYASHCCSPGKGAVRELRLPHLRRTTGKEIDSASSPRGRSSRRGAAPWPQHLGSRRSVFLCRYTVASKYSTHAFSPSMNGPRNASPRYWSIRGSRTAPSSITPYSDMMSRASEASTRSDSAGSLRDHSIRAATNAYIAAQGRHAGGSLGSIAGNSPHLPTSTRYEIGAVGRVSTNPPAANCSSARLTARPWYAVALAIGNTG